MATIATSATNPTEVVIIRPCRHTGRKMGHWTAKRVDFRHIYPMQPTICTSLKFQQPVLASATHANIHMPSVRITVMCQFERLSLIEHVGSATIHGGSGVCLSRACCNQHRKHKYNKCYDALHASP